MSWSLLRRRCDSSERTGPRRTPAHEEASAGTAAERWAAFCHEWALAAEVEGEGAPALCHERVAHEADSEWGGPVGAVTGERSAVRRVWRQCYWTRSAVAGCFLSFVAFP